MKRQFGKVCALVLALLLALGSGVGGVGTQVAYAATPTVVQLAAGMDFSLALFSDGSLWSWGKNDYGQLGDGTTVSRTIPKNIGTGFTAISAGNYHVLALKGNALYAWGWNEYYQIGTGQGGVYSYTSSPTYIGSGYTKISAGASHSAALKGNNLYTWGAIGYSSWSNGSQFFSGDGTSSVKKLPTYIGSNFTDITAGTDFTVGVKGTALYVWGGTANGRYVIDDYKYFSQSDEAYDTETGRSYNNPGDIPEYGIGTPKFMGNGFTSVSAGKDFALALNGSTLYSWGKNQYDQLGYSNTGPVTAPRLVGSGYTAVEASENYSLLLKGDVLYGCGHNGYGQLVNEISGSSVFTWISNNVKLFAAGGQHILVSDGKKVYRAGEPMGAILDEIVFPGLSQPDTVDVTSIGLNTTSISLKVGENATLTATVSPSDATDKSVTWSSGDPAVATVSGGVVTAKAVGTTVITAASVSNPDKKATCTVTVSSNTVAVTSVALNKTSDSLKVDQTTTLTATVSPFNATNKNLAWSSSNESVASVSGGVVTAKAAGTAIITATSLSNPDKKATCTVTVSSNTVAVTSVTLNKTSDSLKVGQTTTLTATVSPFNATNKNLAWSSSNESVASVSGGVVTAKAAGTAIITAASVSNPDKKATCTITVSSNTVAVTKVSVSKGSLKLEVGKTATLSATLKPSNATDKSVTWKSSNSKVAKVTTSGKITAVKAGTATITVASVSNPDKKATCTVTVSPKTVAVTKVSLSKSSLKLDIGKSATLSATLKPSNATDKRVTWKSSNSKVAKVTSSGKITAVKAGAATITVTTASGAKTAKCTVTVVSPVTSIITPQSTVYLKKGASATLTAVAVTADGSKATLKWKSSDAKTVSVDSKGKIKALKTGTATITVSADNGKTAKISVVVGGKSPKSVSVKNPPKNNTMKVGDTLKLNISYMPSDAQGTITFKSSNAKILSVDASGQLKAIKKGIATITVTMGTKKATLKITVK